MIFGKRKRKEKPPATINFKTPCELGKHRYMDFDWFIRYYDGGTEYWVEVVEPYVCVNCGHRIDEVIYHIDISPHLGRLGVHQKIDELEKKYSQQIKPFIVIEDKIKDMLYVDREYLNIMRQLHPENLGGNGQ